ncbi:MAG: helix-turn-helix domain-containing protein, partial [Myxococcota bacterium]
NKDLEESIRDGSFREDLYYRLNVFPIHIPPLRERVGDITLLADYFIDKYSKSNHKAVRRISTAALDMLTRYHWPGNVRELENCMERAVLLTRDDVIRSHHLPPSLQTAEASGTVHHGTLKATLEALEYELLVDALKTSRGNMAEAARHLGITERMMGCRVRKYGINRKRFKK